MGFLAMLWMILTLVIIHFFFVLIFNFFINPHEPSTFAKIFPYQFINNLLFKGTETKPPYFSIRVDINTSKRNVKGNNKGVEDLIDLADRYRVPITFSIATEYIPVISKEVIMKIKEGEHDVISHSHIHTYIGQQNQSESIGKSKGILEKVFEQDIIGFIAPNGKHDKKTLEAARENGVKFLSSGALSHIRYWSFPYPFKKDGIWLLGGAIKSDHQLYEVDGLKSSDAVKIWKKAIAYRAKKGWYTQLEYHNFSTSHEKLKALEEIFKYVKKDEGIIPITQSDMVLRLENKTKKDGT